MSRRPRPFWQRDRNRGSATRADAGVSAVSVGDCPDDGQSEPGAVARAVVGAREAVEGRRVEAVGDAGAVVGDGEVDVIGVLTQAGSDGALAMEKGVVEE